MVRLLLALVVGATVSFGLFYFMAFLIASGENRNKEQIEEIKVEIFTTPPESTAQVKTRVPPPPPPPPQEPPKAPEPEPDNNDVDTDGFQMSGPSVNIANDGISLTGPTSIGQDGDAQPIVRIEPKYPMVAQRNGTEGWVRLSFSIDEVGGVTDIEIVEAKPKRVFNRAAKRALKRWKYKPKIVDGKPIKQTGLTVQLDFTMEND